MSASQRGLAVTVDARGAVAAAVDPTVWTSTVDAQAVAARLDGAGSDTPAGPLRGVPFAVKDNIDVAGLPTTAGCPAFASVPATHATAVGRLVAAGAVVVGKTNLDQFATGLVGVRSPYGTPTNLFDARLVPGGSSSGSAIAVASGAVPFALGTDTAGSGRIPAAISNIVGFKPTRGLVSSTGVVPACRSLDCVSVFALTAADAGVVFDVIDHLDPADIFARGPACRSAVPARRPADLVIGVPDDRWIAECDGPFAEAFARHVEELQVLGVRVVGIDLASFLAVGDLLYRGPWVAERLAAVGAFVREHPDDVLDVTRSIILGAERFTAVEAFEAEYRRRALALEADLAWTTADVIALPSLPGVPTLDEVAADPLGPNSRLGRFSTFVNLLDLCAVAVPGGFTGDGLPAGFTLVAPANHDRLILGLADSYQRAYRRPLGATGVVWPPPEDTGGAPPGDPTMVGETTVALAVVGAHLSGQPLNGQLTTRGARLAARTTTSPSYRLYALDGTVPPKPGLLRVPRGGAAIEVEVWDVPVSQFGSFVDAVPAPLAIGKLELADGRWVSGFVCEPAGLDGATDITAHGAWRTFLAKR